jgi:hypothetical protein
MSGFLPAAFQVGILQNRTTIDVWHNPSGRGMIPGVRNDDTLVHHFRHLVSRAGLPRGSNGAGAPNQDSCHDIIRTLVRSQIHRWPVARQIARTWQSVNKP